MNRERRNSATQELTVIAVCVSLMAICSYISLPFFSNISFTLQLFAVFLISASIPTRQSLCAVLIYTLLGLIGVPVFAGFRGGPSTLFGVTGGYLLGFLLSTLVIGLSIKFFGRKKYVIFLSMLAALLICYVLGTLWFLGVTSPTNNSPGLAGAISICVIPYIIPDLAKILLAASISEHIHKVLKI